MAVIMTDLLLIWVVTWNCPSIGLPTATGTCDHENFYVSVKLGSMGPNMLTMIGKTTLTTEIGNRYGYEANGTHFSIAVPFRTVDAIYEVMCIPHGLILI